MHLDSVTELLEIANYKVTHMIDRKNDRLEFVLKRVEEYPCVCSACGGIHRIAVHSIDMVRVEDLPISGKRVFLHVPKRRTLCPKDNRIRTEELDWLRGRVTRRFAEQIYRLTIWNHEGRGKSVFDKFYHKIGKEGCTKIEAVASDGARGFLSSTKEHLKNALIVLDHFHIKKYLNDAVDTVRKEELRKARQQDNGELSGILHCNKRFILMQNTVTDKRVSILEKLSLPNNPVYRAMLLKEQFLSIYAAGNWKVAYTNLREWIVTAIKSEIPLFVELGYKFFRMRHYVLNCFICKITSAVSEGINNKIKRLKRMAYGYRDVKYFLLKIHQHCGLLSPRIST